MVSDEEDSHVNVPSYFRCPISLDVMKSPVSLCTGVTYDRSSIQRWFDDGNNTCPATMQVLHNKDLIPNYTLQRLIKIWVDSSLPNRPPTSPPPPLHSINATQLLHQLHTQLRSIRKHASSSAPAITLNINRLTSFAAESEENAANCGTILPLLVSVVGKVKDDLGLLEKVIVFTNVLVKNSEKNIVVVEDHEIDLKSSILTCMKQGRLELRMAVAKFLNLIISTKLRLGTHSSSISEDEEILSETLKLITTCDWNSETVDDCLSFLTSWSISKRNNRVKVVRGGGVKVVAAALSAADMRAATTTEKALKLLELMSACKEGRSEICGSEVCVKAVVKKLLKVSTAATEQAVAVLWNLCCLFGEKRAAGAVVEGNGMGKMLMVMQSNCSPAVRQMCGDLLRVLRSSSKTCWYDTKTTHITPF